MVKENSVVKMEVKFYSHYAYLKNHFFWINKKLHGQNEYFHKVGYGNSPSHSTGHLYSNVICNTSVNYYPEFIIVSCDESKIIFL